MLQSFKSNTQLTSYIVTVMRIFPVALDCRAERNLKKIFNENDKG